KERPGFTLIELLVVIAIIGVLIALLLPAVQAAREAARRSQCLNNLKQLGLAMANYEGAQGSYPMAYFQQHYPTGWASSPPYGGWDSAGPMVTILPYLEQAPVFAAWNSDLGMYSDENATVIGTGVSTIWCPSDGSISDASYSYGTIISNAN